jgi:thiamine-phosphate pyrophosphorylase
MMNSDSFRMMDANFNRLNEGLRVLEDIHRFILNDVSVSSVLKGFRHQLAEIFQPIDLIQARDAASDQGKSLEGSGEYQRENVQDLLISNFKRCEQSLRVLEELSKMEAGALAKALENMRYQIYELEQKSLCFKLFPDPCLYVLITKKLCKLDPLDVLKGICDGGASVIQLREKEMEDGEFLRWIEEAKSITDSYGIPLIVNDRIQLVQLTGVQGVHMGQGDLPTHRARQLLKPWQWLGRSTHELSQAIQAESEGVDYIGVGPLFPTNTKVHREAVGLAYLHQVNEQTKVPYVGIGSVNESTLPEILPFKPKGLAICTGIIAAADPQKNTEVFRKQILSVN